MSAWLMYSIFGAKSAHKHTSIRLTGCGVNACCDLKAPFEDNMSIIANSADGTFVEVGGYHGAEAVTAVQLQQQRACHARVDHVAPVHAVPARTGTATMSSFAVVHLRLASARLMCGRQARPRFALPMNSHKSQRI